MHTNHLYILFFFGVGGDLSIYLGISTSLEAGERHSFYLFIFLSLPVYDYFFFCARPQIQIHECAHTKRAASRDYRYRYNLFLFVCFLLYLFLFFFTFLLFSRTATQVTVSRKLKRRLWLCSGDVSLESTFSKIKIARSFFWPSFVVMAAISPTLGYMCFFSE